MCKEKFLKKSRTNPRVFFLSFTELESEIRACHSPPSKKQLSLAFLLCRFLHSAFDMRKSTLDRSVVGWWCNGNNFKLGINSSTFRALWDTRTRTDRSLLRQLLPEGFSRNGNSFSRTGTRTSGLPCKSLVPSWPIMELIDCKVAITLLYYVLPFQLRNVRAEVEEMSPRSRSEFIERVERIAPRGRRRSIFS